MPVYMQPPTTFEELMNPLPKEIQGISIRLRKSIIEALPEADETINGGKKMGMALYSINNTNNVVCGFQPTDTMCKLFFHGWKELENRGFKLEGAGKNARHIKLRAESEFQPTVVEEMLAIVKNKFIK